MPNSTLNSAGSRSDISQRLQQKIASWRGTERGQTVKDLHEECRGTFGLAGNRLLPARILLVDDLNATSLQQSLNRFNGSYRRTEARFRVRPIGHFDMALVPTGPAGSSLDRWLLALEAGLSVDDQVALYAHAVGHLLLNQSMKNVTGRPILDPGDNRSHVDNLAELRLLDNTRDDINQRVLGTYPELAELLQPREAPGQTPAPLGLRERLAGFGWRGHLVTSPYIFTDGRIFVTGDGTRRGRRLREDALLRAEASLPIALVHTLREGESRQDAERRLVEYGRDRLCVPYAYLLDDDVVQEFDWTESTAAFKSELTVIPSRDILLSRWTQSLGLADRDIDALKHPYQLSRHIPRYYQEAAINRAVIAVLQAKRGFRDPRILLNLATGTGKTPVAFQLAWKLKRTRAVRNILFITDRDYLLSQAMDNHFAPFGDARDRIRGGRDTAHDVLFATYQALAGDQSRSGIYLEYPEDFFDLIIIDECHRGGASAESNWRGILEYFKDAIQIGMTATPLRTDNVQTYEYFGEPVAVYSLRRGINDGYLAPYRVLRVRLGEEIEEEAVGAADTCNQDEHPADGGESTEVEMETVQAPLLVKATDTIAKHLVDYMRSTDPMAKTIVFCVDQSHARQMRNAIRREATDVSGQHSDYTVRIVSEEQGTGRRALGKFSSPDENTPVVVTTSKLLTTGVDVPTCKNIVIARPVGSFVEFKQIIGRGTRLHEPQKTWFTIIDYAGAIKHFFDPEFDGDPEVVAVEVLKPNLPEGEVEFVSEEEFEEPLTEIEEETKEQPEVTGETEEPEEEAVTEEKQPEVTEEEILPEEQEKQHEEPEGIESELPGEEQEAPEEEATTAESEEDVPPEGEIRTRPRDNTRIVVQGEMVFELGPDGRTIRKTNYPKYTKDALESISANPDELRQRWFRREQREEIEGILADECIHIPELARSLNTPDADPLDLLLHVVFDEPLRTRHDRAQRLRTEHAEFFSHYDGTARNVLEAILSKYEIGETDGVNDSELIKVPPVSDLGRPMELMKAFGDGNVMREALREMEALLYSD